MASKCFYLILHSVLFVISVFVAQVLSDSAGQYLIEDAQQDFDITFIPLAIQKRQVVLSDKKPEVPIEDKARLTKKPTALDVKSTPAVVPELGSEKPRLAVNKKESLKALNETVLHTEPHDVVSASETNQQHGETTRPTFTNVSSLHLTTPLPTTPLSTTKSYSKASGSVFANVSLPDPDIQITKMFDVNFMETLKEHNITQEKLDYHLYYNSTFIVDPELGRKYWVDLDKQKNVKVSDILSQAYRRAMTVKLSFEFPFYGHLIRNITIASGGFLYTGEYVHSWLAATQYIAPLMANFDTSLSDQSFVKYVDNGTAFTVQWENVILQEKPHRGGFTFQCTLHKNGDIIFVYQQVAVVLEEIEDDQHPVKVGLSDAYIIDRTIFFVRRKTIYEYHRVNFQKEDIKNWTVIVLNALDTCLDMKDCHSCLTQLENFKCNWCANKCSNGMDRHRQEWITNGCDKIKLMPVEKCAKENSKPTEYAQPSLVLPHKDEGVNIGIAGIIGILFVVCLGLGAGIWLFFAYRNPHTPAGQFLIRYRPSQWSWRRGEARYTAATIHM